jgi:hypothetical protein
MSEEIDTASTGSGAMTGDALRELRRLAANAATSLATPIYYLDPGACGGIVREDVDGSRREVELRDSVEVPLRALPRRKNPEGLSTHDPMRNPKYRATVRAISDRYHAEKGIPPLPKQLDEAWGRQISRETTLRPRDLAEASARALIDDRGRAFPLDEFCDEFYLDHPDKVCQQRRLDPVPVLTGDAELDAWIGAIGEHLARRWGLEIPDWTERPGHFAVREPIFMPPSPALKEAIIEETPIAFRRRLIFTFAEPLRRARFPRDRTA